MRWDFLLGACVAVGTLLPLMGAPVVPVAAGIALVVTWNWLRRRYGVRRP